MSRPADPRRRPAAVLALVAGGLGLTVALAVPAAAAGATESWAPEIALAGGDDRAVALVGGAVRPTGAAVGELVLAPRRTAGAVAAVSGVAAAETPAGSSVAVEVRGLGADGHWGPWVALRGRASVALLRPTGELSVRVLLRPGPDGAVPALRGLWLTTARSAPARTTTETTTVTTTVPVTLVPTTTTTTPTSTTVPSTTTATVAPTTSTTTTTTVAPTTTATVPSTTTTTAPPTTTTTTARIPPPGLVLDLPPDPPYVPTPAPAAAETPSSWWGADLLAWLARAF